MGRKESNQTKQKLCELFDKQQKTGKDFRNFMADRYSYNYSLDLE